MTWWEFQITDGLVSSLPLFSLWGVFSLLGIKLNIYND